MYVIIIKKTFVFPLTFFFSLISIVLQTSPQQILKFKSATLRPQISRSNLGIVFLSSLWVTPNIQFQTQNHQFIFVPNFFSLFFSLNKPNFIFTNSILKLINFPILWRIDRNHLCTYMPPHQRLQFNSKIESIII